MRGSAGTATEIGTAMVQGASHSLFQALPDEEGCTVLPGFFGYVVQFLLFLVCVLALVLKKLREGPGRTWWEFGLDSSKQILGSGYMHLLNLGTATIMNRMTSGSDECTWYWVQIMIDDTLGTLVTYLLLRLITRALDRGVEGCCGPWVAAEDFHTGEYWKDGVFRPKRYILQLIVWLVILTCMKYAMIGLIVVLRVPLGAAANWLLSPVRNHNRIKLLLVMIFTPVVMNTFQYFVTDNFIMKSAAACSEGGRAGETEALVPQEHGAAAGKGSKDESADTRAKVA